jgi:hypothetical protein
MPWLSPISDCFDIISILRVLSLYNVTTTKSLIAITIRGRQPRCIYTNAVRSNGATPNHMEYIRMAEQYLVDDIVVSSGLLVAVTYSYVWR